MSFWLREFLGWMFLVFGMALFTGCILFVRERQVVEATILAVVGIVLFRAGIHLLKVAVAARIYLDSREKPAEPATNRRPVNLREPQESP